MRRPISVLASVLVAVAILGCSFAGGRTAAADIDIPYEKFALENGLTVIIHEDRKAPVVAVAVWYKVGSKDEPEGKTGFAHLFEHLMFNGTENYDGEWFEPLKEVGATSINGTTNTDRTNYFQTVPTNALERVLWMESDRMGHFLGAVTQDKLDEQRGVVQNEKRQGENRPYGRVFTHVLEGLFPKGHPYAHTTIGSMADLDAASLEDVQGWFEEYYGPSNAILVLAGDIDAATARPLVDKYFGDIEPGPPLAKWQSWTPARGFASREVLYDQVPQARIYRLWATPEDENPVSTDLFIAANVLGDGKNSRLYKDLVYDKQIATDVSVFNYELLMASIFGVVVDVKPGESVEEAEAALDAQIEAFLRKGPSRAEVELVATKTTANIIRGLEEVGGFSGKAVTLAHGELVAGEPGYFKRELAELEAAGPKSVLAAARRWLGDDWHQITVLPYPEYSRKAEGVDRSTGLPSVVGEIQLDFPEIQETTLSNGVTVALAQRSAVPVVNVAVQFDAGYAADSGGKLGLAKMAMGMLDEGAGGYDALALSAALERLGAQLGASSNLDTSQVTLSALKENLGASLNLMADVIRRPAFDDDELARQKALALAGIAQEKADPVRIALRRLPPLIYGEEHAYGIPLTGSGTEESVASMTRADLVAFHNTWLRPDNAKIFVVGDTTLDEITPLLESAFGDWRASGQPGEKVISTAQLPSEPMAIIVDRPGAPQTHILAGHIAPPADVENDVAIMAMNEILGGDFISRINLNLREDKSWSYGVRTIVLGARAQRPFLILAPVQTSKTGAAIAELKKEFADILGPRKPTANELERVKLDNIRSLPGRFETSDAVLGSLLANDRFGRPYDYEARLPEKYRALSTADLSAAANEVLRPDRLVWILIGDAEKIEQEVRAAGIGEVTITKATEL